MKEKIFRYAVMMVIAGCMARAADAGGTWRLSYSTENGLPREATLNLKLEGDRLTGTLSSDRGLARIDDGKVSGDEIRFDVIRKGNGDEITIHFQGRVEGETMKLTLQFGRRNPIEITARRAL